MAIAAVRCREDVEMMRDTVSAITSGLSTALGTKEPGGYCRLLDEHPATVASRLRLVIKERKEEAEKNNG